MFNSIDPTIDYVQESQANLSGTDNEFFDELVLVD